ncbi:Ribosomal RNA-processing protein 12 [Psilocybe cubensis]|uniref:Ribosomal RNA-processing protein 12 n=2 Tax=Psilocybe cubensis TaxID=181762 RepID=A0ACB8HDD1_PSICU|nr:Ribosomal RNA-processing protein 12 [Psilocybe cubensis]KAH9485194.1 Ribosomal RNA-processing protein 12 [Psilocybe cubensis]
MEEALEKIRPHTSSSLPHQKTPANLLIALESTFKDQNTEATSTAYFAALLTTLDGTIQKKDVSLDDGAILPAELYLLALVAPYVPAPVMRSNLNTLLSLTAPLFPSLTQHAPSLRSQLSLYHAIFHSVDRSHLEAQGVRQTFASILQLCIDPRPKVRKKAVDVVKDVLANPPTPLLLHPYAERVAEWALATLSEVNAGPFAKGKSAKQTAAPGAEIAIHVLAFLRPIIPHLPSEALPSITNILLTLPRLGNTYLSQSSYSILTEIFQTSVEDVSTNVGSQLSEVLKVVLSSLPSKSDSTLSASWVQVLGGAMAAHYTLDPDKASKEVGKVWKSVWNFMDSTDVGVRKATSEALCSISSCFSSTLISAAVSDKDGSSTIRKIVAQVSKALDSLQYARAIPEILSVISAFITNLQVRSSKTSPTATELLLMPLIVRIADLRISKGFEHKEAADSTLSVAMRILGPEVLLGTLPLNLEPGDRKPGSEPRAFLLPLLAQPHSSHLSHFVSYFVPLSERMFDLQQKAETEGRQAEAKMWSVLVGQIWAGLSGYCIGTANLKESLSTGFSQLLSQLLYGQPDLRVSILKALKIMIDSNLVLTEATEEEMVSSTALITQQEAKDNIEFLRTQVESWLAVLFNVYGSVGRDSRGLIGEVIVSWASIAGTQEIHNAFLKVVQLFKTSLPMAQKTLGNISSAGDIGNMTTTSQDILILLLTNLSVTDSQALFEFTLTPEVLSCKDNGVQKRGYKILAKLVDAGDIAVDPEVVLRKLDDLTEGLTAAAKKDRFNLLASLIDLLPSSSLHIIPSLIPEVVLGTKEPSEKARTAAFEAIISMGRKMSVGGVVKRSMVDGMEEDGAEDAVASIEEFLTMIAGGLAGASPHMISATVTAISRLVFEFKESISPNMHNEILTTLLVFLSSANREIVKSILGFVKLAIHTLPVDLIRPHLKELVPALLNWSHDHKNHFKVKVRHIFERMLRRFSWDEIYSCAGEEEAAKVLVNIKKRKERAKRKKANKAEADEDDNEPTPAKITTGDAFEDVLYGSESELDDSDDEQAADAAPSSSKKKNNSRGDVRLRLDGDEPIDLLQGAATHLTNANSNRRRQPGKDAARFRTDEDTGKMIIDANSDSEGPPEGPPNEIGATDVAGTAYRESMVSVDGFTRGPNGRIKFHKDTKKRRREEEAMDVEMADSEEVTGSKPKKSKKKSEVNFGHEFKAKKAGGDVKKGGVDPYAYLSLSQAAKSGRKSGISGKR